MSQGANVDDIDIFRTMKVAVIRFKQAAETTLMNADAQVARTLSWLENEQTTYWLSQIRKRTEAVGRAKEAVRMKKLFKDSSGRIPNAAQEEKILHLALQALAEAETKLAATKRSIPKLQKEIEVFRGSVNALGNALATDLPRAIAMLERLSLSMDQYVELASGGSSDFSPNLPPPESPPSTPAPETPAPPTPGEPTEDKNVST